MPDLLPTPPAADLDPLAIDQRDAARLTGLSAKTLGRLADAGEPVGRVKVGRRVLYHRATLAAWLSARAAGRGAYYRPDPNTRPLTQSGRPREGRPDAVTVGCHSRGFTDEQYTTPRGERGRDGARQRGESLPRLQETRMVPRRAGRLRRHLHPRREREALRRRRLAEPAAGAPAAKKNPPGAPKDWPARAATFAANLDAGRRKGSAAKLGLPTDALDALPLLGFNPDDPAGACVTFAEVDVAGNVVGLLRRFPDGRKKAMRGGKRGLTLPTGWRDRPGPAFVVEGPTDAAALTAAGLCAVGRPSNAGGVKLLADLFRDLDAGREIVVVGENDRKPAGAWPGRAGALSVARGLAAALGRPVRWALPPADAKDVRDWLTADARAAAPWEARG